MCTVVLSVEPGKPVLLAGVRDELTDRPWEPPAAHWPAYPGLIGGRDLQAGGTWLAVMPSRPRASCVLNGVGVMAAAATRRSRGELPLAGAVGELVMPAEAGQSPMYYDPFRLIVAEPGWGLLWTWDGAEQSQQALVPGLHVIVNSGMASQSPRGEAAQGDAAAEQLVAETAANWSGAEWCGAPPPDGREHELARTTYFLGRFLAAARPDPRPGEPASEAWGEWFPLVNGDGIGPDDPRALIVRRDLGGGRTWGTTSISLVALGPGWLRYDFTAQPGDASSWYEVV